VLSAFTPTERAQFLALLDKLIAKFNDTTRAPLEERGGNRRLGRALARPNNREHPR